MTSLPVSSMCLFSVLSQGAVGLAATLAFADGGGGWDRDFPPAGRRLAGLVVPALAGAALVSPFVEVLRRGGEWAPPPWVILAVAGLLPFGALSLVWGLAWSEGRPALVRRLWGGSVLQTGLLGLVLSLTFMLALWDGPHWRMGVMLAVMVGTTAVLGGVGTLALAAPLPDRNPPAVTTGVPTAVLKGGLVISGLALADAGWTLVGSPAAPGAGWYVLAWLGGGLAVPALALIWAAPRWRWWPWRLVWWPVLVIATVGQWSAHHLMFAYPGMVPLPVW